MHGVRAELDYRRGYPPVVNPPNGAAMAAAAAADAVGREHVLTEFQPSMGCEDFAFMLQGVGDGAYAWIGAGDVGPGEGLHGDRFVFNDAIIPIGIRFFLSVVQRALSARPARRAKCRGEPSPKVHDLASAEAEAKNASGSSTSDRRPLSISQKRLQTALTKLRSCEAMRQLASCAISSASSAS